MIKIKQFREELCRTKYTQNHFELILSELLDEKINDFMKDKDVIDVKVNSFAARHHNNGGHNTQYALITVIYKEAV